MASRRSVLAWFVGGLALPTAAAQTRSKPRRVALLMPLSQNDVDAKLRVEALARGLRDLGWVDNQNLQMEIRYAAGSEQAMRRYGREFAASKPDLLVVVSNQALAIVREEMVALPTLFISVSDPVGGGFVSNLSRPGGDTTGFTNYDPTTGAKWLEVLQELSPNVSHVGLLLNARIAANVALASGVEAAAAARRVTTERIDARDAAEVERGLASLATQPNAGVVVMPNPSNIVHQRLIIDSAAKHRLPAVYPFSHMARSGGLVAYGIDQLEQYRAAARYVDRILKGAKPGDLPVQQPSAYELAINLRAARELGLKPPPPLLARANEVVE
jgi:putative tryptophan/tyrosine transport system substrate-binding protein